VKYQYSRNKGRKLDSKSSTVLYIMERNIFRSSKFVMVVAAGDRSNALSFPKAITASALFLL
jgi:hypothetical protein